jgi:hypothetical protein
MGTGQNMSADLTIVNTALMVIAAAALVQMVAMVLVVVSVRRASERAILVFDQEIRPVLSRLSRAAEVVENTGRGVGEASDDARRVLSTFSKSASSVAPVLAPRAWLAARLVTWAVRKGVRRLATKGA